MEDPPDGAQKGPQQRWSATGGKIPNGNNCNEVEGDLSRVGVNSARSAVHVVEDQDTHRDEGRSPSPK